MFEHMKNYKMLMSKVSSWLRPKASPDAEEALFFVHIFCHRTTPYHFEQGDGWMSKTFFSGLFITSTILSLFRSELSLQVGQCLHTIS